MEYSGNIDITARNVFKEAYSAGIIKEQGIFIDMMLSRNLLSHTYDFAKFKEVIIKIENDYLNVLEDLHNFFINKLEENY